MSVMDTQRQRQLRSMHILILQQQQQRLIVIMLPLTFKLACSSSSSQSIVFLAPVLPLLLAPLLEEYLVGTLCHFTPTRIVRPESQLPTIPLEKTGEPTILWACLGAWICQGQTQSIISTLTRELLMMLKRKSCTPTRSSDHIFLFAG